jgi:predicted Zn-dependent protease
VNPLPHQDNLYLQAADGWLGLGNWREAELELARINPEFSRHPRVMEIQFQVLGAAKRWSQAAQVAEAFRQLQPDEPWGHFHLAFALHELKDTQAAYATLRSVLEQYPDNWLMRYNVACYACQLGRPNEALTWLTQAITLAGRRQVHALALEDADLAPLHDRIRKL